MGVRRSGILGMLLLAATLLAPRTAIAGGPAEVPSRQEAPPGLVDAADHLITEWLAHFYADVDDPTLYRLEPEPVEVTLGPPHAVWGVFIDESVSELVALQRLDEWYFVVYQGGLPRNIVSIYEEAGGGFAVAGLGLGGSTLPATLDSRLSNEVLLFDFMSDAYFLMDTITGAVRPLNAAAHAVAPDVAPNLAVFYDGVRERFLAMPRDPRMDGGVALSGTGDPSPDSSGLGGAVAAGVFVFALGGVLLAHSAVRRRRATSPS